MLPVTAIFNRLTEGQPPRLNFPKDPQARAIFLSLAEKLIIRIGDQYETSIQFREQMMLRLGNHCARHRINTPKAAADFEKQIPDLVDALTEKPELIFTHQISNILGKHQQHKTQASARKRSEMTRLEGDAGAPPVIWKGSSGYTLVELIAPAHLRAESEALDHCIGTRFNEMALIKHRFAPGKPESYQHLLYASKIRMGECRIFSLRDPHGVSCATLRYDKKAKEITELEGKPATVFPDVQFLPELCQALSALSDMMPVGRIQGLRTRNAGEYFTKNGRQIQADQPPAKGFLFGACAVTDATPQDQLEALAANPRLTLDITHLSDTHRLPRHIKADLVHRNSTYLETLDLGHVVSMASLDCHTRSINLRSLRTCHDLTLPWLYELSLPQLEKSLSLNAADCTKVHAPLWQTARNIHLRKLDTLPHLPALRRAWSLILGEKVTFTDPGERTTQLDKVHLPALRQCFGYSSDALRQRLPQLETCDSMKLTSATHAELDRLRAAEDIVAPYLRRAHLSRLHHGETLEFERCAELRAPELRFAGEILVARQASLHLPALDKTVPVKRLGPGISLRNNEPNGPWLG